MQRRGSISNKPGNVYFLELLDPSKTFDFPFYKIGITENEVSSRIDQLQTGNPFKILRHNSLNSQAMEMVEKYLHNLYSSNRIRREWFRFNSNEISSVLKEAERYNSEINSLIESVNEFDTEPSNGKIIEPNAETTDIHNSLKDLLGDKRQLEAKEEIAEINLRILTSNTRGIEGITDRYLRGGGQRFSERDVKKEHPEVYQKYVEMQTQTYEPETEIIERFSSRFTVLKKPSIINFPELQQELNENKTKLADSKKEDLDKKVLQQTKQSRAFHEEFLDTRQKIGILDGRIDALGLKLRYHCRDNDGIEGICNYVRKLDIEKPDPDAKPEVSEYEYFDSQKFEESEPELYKQYLQEMPSSPVFQVIKYRDYI